MLRSDLVPGALLHLSSRRETSLPFAADGLAIVLGKAEKRRRNNNTGYDILNSPSTGYDILFRGEVVTFYAASTPTKLILSAQINPELPNIYYTFKPILLAGAPHDRQQWKTDQEHHRSSSRR